MAARSFLHGGASTGGDAADGPVLLTNKRVHCSSSLSLADPFFASRSSSFRGSRSMLSFEDRGKGSGGELWQSFDHEDDNEYDEYNIHQPEKKRRLTADQVGFLEKSFVSDNRLEPERKVQLAKELGLQPRQVAIWFQNRRARWKNKQLEKDYDDLQESYNKLKANYENLVKEKEKLQSEVDELSDRMMLQEKLGTSTPSQNGYYFTDKTVNGVQASLKERVNSSNNVIEQEPSDGSLDEESKMFLPSYASPKMNDIGGYTDPHTVNSYYPGLPGDDQAFGFWPY